MTDRPGPPAAKPRVAFFASVRDPKLLDMIGFYSADLATLDELSYDVVRCTHWRDVVRARPDIVYAWWWHRSLHVALWSAVTRRPMIITGATDFHMPWQSQFKRLGRIALTAVVGRLVRANLAISDFEFKDLQSARARNRQRVYLSIDTDYYTFQPVPPQKPSAAIIAQLYVGSIQRKGVDTAIRAALAAREQLPGFQLHLVGPEDERGKAVVDELVAGLPPDLVVRHGRVEADVKRQILSSVTVYLQPSLYEGFGVAVAEAMSCGAVPIVSDAGSLPEVARRSGSVVAGATVGGIADEVVRICSLPDDELCRARALARSEAEFFGMGVRRDELQRVMETHAPVTVR